MSPRVQLVLYPHGDPEFAEHAAIGLDISVPPQYSPAEIVAAIQAHLRERYPLATIQVEPDPDDAYEARWHVYRDGLPAEA